MRALLLIVFLALLPLGCGIVTEPESNRSTLRLDVGESIVFRAEKDEYLQGETATILLRNETDDTLGYNLCVSARELRTGGGWTRFDPLRVCTAALYHLAPGEEAILREPITAEWQPGRYRMVTRVTRIGRDVGGEIFTPSFTVLP